MQNRNPEQEREVWARVLEREPETAAERMARCLRRERQGQREALYLAQWMGQPDAATLHKLAREMFERETALQTLAYLRTGRVQREAAPPAPLPAQDCDVLALLRRLYRAQNDAKADYARLAASEGSGRARFRALEESAQDCAARLERMVQARL